MKLTFITIISLLLSGCATLLLYDSNRDYAERLEKRSDAFRKIKYAEYVGKQDGAFQYNLMHFQEQNLVLSLPFEKSKKVDLRLHPDDSADQPAKKRLRDVQILLSETDQVLPASSEQNVAEYPTVIDVVEHADKYTLFYSCKLGTFSNNLPKSEVDISPAESQKLVLRNGLYLITVPVDMINPFNYIFLFMFSK